MIRFIDGFINPALLRQDQLDMAHRARVMLIIPLAVGVSHIYSFVSIYSHLDKLGEFRWVVWLAGLSVLLLLLSVVVFWRTGAFLLAANTYALGATLAMLSLVLVTGGFKDSPFLVLWPLVVVFTFLMAGIYTALFWCVTCQMIWWLGITAGAIEYPRLIPDHWVETVTTVTVLNAGIVMIGVLWLFDYIQRQLQERLQMERDRALFTAAHDPLTGLANRKTFESQLIHVINQQRGPGCVHALLLMDLDDFKIVNDTYGHASGDALLKVVAGRLKSSVRRSDLAARLGGDEFGLLLVDVRSADDLMLILKNIHRAVTAQVDLANGQCVAVGASIGIALVPDDGGNPEELLHSADLAMYWAKGNKRNYAYARDMEMERV